ncbi:MAG: protoporphyrinogen oxidase [Acidobacteria bacterium RIFCSPLOWO2_02_FULL_67_36]|nr:MAG: protoporphyrinogen oxidase [Acidobacteria bacterium RIFCSPLOWO2_02_FULL_67_36]OFW24477.1 MAG: protoporphyrinogen oxidase [Acidobacteria bacterium RIFCSPLOWO2_12_FULL_66_21]
MTRIVIAGAGIAGLSIAHAIRERDPAVDLVVLEGADRPGGNVRTEVLDGYTCEWGPDGFLDNAPDTLRLAHDVGLDSRVLPSNDSARRRFIFRAGRLHEAPLSPVAFLRSGLLSPLGKARIAWEPFARRRPEIDETIHEFAERRIGREAATIMIDSMVSGIFAGDARALSLRACFPKMWQMESDHGGLFRAMLATRRRRAAAVRTEGMGQPAGRLTSFTAGMRELIDGVAAAVGGALRVSTPVIGLRPGTSALAFRSDLAPSGFTVITPRRTRDADAVVLTGPSSDAAGLVRPFDSTLASVLADIETAPLAVVAMGFEAAGLAADRGPLDGFGFLVPRCEGIRILGALWESSIYADRAPEGKALIRVMIGGARDPGVVDVDDDELVAIVRRELRQTMRLNVAPEFVRVIRHRRGIPQYTRGHVARLQRIDTLLQAHRGLFLAGNSYRGVSINSCVAEAGQIADNVLRVGRGEM